MLKTRFIIDPKDFKKSLMSVLFYFNDADESNEITENEKIATKLILQRENKIIKSSLTDEKDYQMKRRL